MGLGLAILSLPLRTQPLGAQSPDLFSDIVSQFGSSSDLWALGLIFIRMTSFVMLLPGIADQNVSPRIRLSFALLAAICFTPALKASLPAISPNIGANLGMVLHEIFAGLILGGLIRCLFQVFSMAGELMSLGLSLSFAQTTNPGQTQGSTTLSTFLTVFGLALIFSTSLHHLFFRAFIDSYALMSPLKPLMVADGADLYITSVSKAFWLAVQLSAPILVFSLIISVASGLIGRLLPAFPIFFATTPVQILGGMSLLSLSLGGIGLVFSEHYQTFLALFIRQP